MTPDDTATLPAPVRAQLRLRLRRWLGLLAPDAPRRSPLRSAVLTRAAARLPVAGRGRPMRRLITEALFIELHRAADTAGAADPFAAAARRWADGAPLPPDPANLAAWDAVLTAAELRPSTVQPDAVARLHARARAAQSDRFARGRYSREARRVVESRGVGPWLERVGVDDADGAVDRLWATLEPALVDVCPPADRPALVRQAMENLVAWDARVARVAAEVTRVRGADAGQATAARLLEPRFMSAWLTLPPDDLVRLGLTCGRHIALATLTRPAPTDTAALALAPEPDPEAAVVDQARWRTFLRALAEVVESGRLDVADAVFLWLAAGVGAGEAWRAVGGDPAKIGSANYRRNRALETLGRATSGVPARLANPGAPDPRTRSLLGQLAMREAPDPSVEGEAEIPPDARDRAPPLGDRDLLALMYLINLGPAGLSLLPSTWPRPDPEALLTRALCNGRWARARRAVVRARLHRAGAVHGWPSIDDLLLVVGGATAGSTVDAAAWAAERVDGGDPTLIERWLEAEGPAHEAIDRLRGIDRTTLRPPDAALPRRPVEREARLRLHLREVTGAPR